MLEYARWETCHRQGLMLRPISKLGEGGGLTILSIAEAKPFCHGFGPAPGLGRNSDAHRGLRGPTV